MLSGIRMTHTSGFSTDYHTKIKTQAGLCSCFTTAYSLRWQERKDNFLSMTAEDQAGEETWPLFPLQDYWKGWASLHRGSPFIHPTDIHGVSSMSQVRKTGLIAIWGSSVQCNLLSSPYLSANRAHHWLITPDVTLKSWSARVGI